MPKTTFAGAAAEIARRDKVMARLMKRTGPFRLPRPTMDYFAALAESILYQQLAGAAARAIHQRFVALFDGALSPEASWPCLPSGFAAPGSQATRWPLSEISLRRWPTGLSHSTASAGFPMRR
jgi:3-methyladenine DNA glycosylase/8-oxoguanine DNA glycosylase